MSSIIYGAEPQVGGEKTPTWGSSTRSDWMKALLRCLAPPTWGSNTGCDWMLS